MIFFYLFFNNFSIVKNKTRDANADFQIRLNFLLAQLQFFQNLINIFWKIVLLYSYMKRERGQLVMEGTMLTHLKEKLSVWDS